MIFYHERPLKSISSSPSSLMLRTLKIECEKKKTNKESVSNRYKFLLKHLETVSSISLENILPNACKL